MYLDNLYVSYGDIQKYIKNCYLKYNKKITVVEALKALKFIKLKENSLSTTGESTLKKSWSYISDEEFIIEIYNLMFPYKEPVDYFPVSNLPYEIPELGFFPKLFDVLVFRQFIFSTTYL